MNMTPNDKIKSLLEIAITEASTLLHGIRGVDDSDELHDLLIEAGESMSDAYRSIIKTYNLNNN